MQKDTAPNGAASSKILQISGGKVVLQIVPREVRVDHGVDLGGNRFFDPVRAGLGDSGFLFVHDNPSNGDSQLLLRILLDVHVFVVLSQFCQHSQGAKVDAGAIDGGLNVCGKRVPVRFHLGVLIFHTITTLRMSKEPKFIKNFRKETKR